MENNFADRSGQTDNVWILACCYLSHIGRLKLLVLFVVRFPNPLALGSQAGPCLVLLLLLVLAGLQTQTIWITSPCAVFLKYGQLYLLRATECISGTLLLLMLGSLDTETIWRPRATTSSHQASNFSLSLSFFLPFSPLTFCVLKHANFAMRGNIIFWLSS